MNIPCDMCQQHSTFSVTSSHRQSHRFGNQIILFVSLLNTDMSIDKLRVQETMNEIARVPTTAGNLSQKKCSTVKTSRIKKLF